MQKNAAQVPAYWFGEMRDGWPRADKNALWFGARPQDDDDMRRRFGALIDAAVAGALDGWRESDEGGMALILLADQMTRATRRGQAAAFAGDAVARAACKAGIAAARDKRLPPAYRMFYYLPLEHSEDIADQRQSVALFTALRRDYPQHAKRLDGALEYAVKHYELIAAFGRFPHRNAILKRESSEEEKRHLAATSERFGQAAR